MDPNVCKVCRGQLRRAKCWNNLEWAWVRCTCAKPVRPNTPAGPALVMVA